MARQGESAPALVKLSSKTKLSHTKHCHSKCSQSLNTASAKETELGLTNNQMDLTKSQMDLTQVAQEFNQCLAQRAPLCPAFCGNH